ncbi:unnamed protein product [Linum trigynum]|uniref:Uncharacterized protein n=1 Tax=Linum trigynum TaxID=586398 RepID=A0AAV2FCJ5_9ROSI
MSSTGVAIAALSSSLCISSTPSPSDSLQQLNNPNQAQSSDPYLRHPHALPPSSPSSPRTSVFPTNQFRKRGERLGSEIEVPGEPGSDGGGGVGGDVAVFGDFHVQYREQFEMSTWSERWRKTGQRRRRSF